MAKPVYPWWLGYLLMNPLRRVTQNPEKILKPYIKENMNVIDAGSGMGFFSLPIARLVGVKGRVVCIDLQEQMIKGLTRRAAKAGLFDRIETRICASGSLEISDLAGEIDFFLAFGVVHEVPDSLNFMKEAHQTLKLGGCLLISEPSHHVSKDEFNNEVEIAQQTGFKVKEYLEIKGSHGVLLTA
ncbi:MAG TPA: methyltransferase type 11 [Firmicutes bacterium]|jgi:2-polyprenyl-3-methyl-5-hydroxy-6-metoxy-1,4-benzoquinol methylase|nr:methyltransferase type 11 [Bacillota bacterium]